MISDSLALVLEYRAKRPALQFINYRRRNAAGQIDAAAGLHRHGRIAGNARQPEMNWSRVFDCRRVLSRQRRLNDGFGTG